MRNGLIMAGFAFFVFYDTVAGEGRLSRPVFRIFAEKRNNWSVFLIFFKDYNLNLKVQRRINFKDFSVIFKVLKLKRLTNLLRLLFNIKIYLIDF